MATQQEIEDILNNNAEKEAFYKLCDLYNVDNCDKELICAIKKIFEPYQKKSFAIAQINTISGNLEYNAKKILKYIEFAQNIGVETVIFPAFTLSGFPLEDIILRYPYFANENKKWLDEIAKLITNTTAVIGFVEPYKENLYYNSVAVIKNQKIIQTIRQSKLPCVTDFHDYRYIQPYAREKATCDNTVIVGEDYEDIEQDNSNAIINCVVSPVKLFEETVLNKKLSDFTKENEKPFIYVNQTGTTDTTVFAGVSRVFDKNGNLFARAKSFEEQILIFNIEKDLGKIYPIAKGLEQNITDNFSLDYENDMERTYKTVISGIQDYFKKNGFKKAVLGLSGGLDSTICAVLLTDALGKENVLGISMPSKITSNESKNDAKQLAENLGINFEEIEIKEVVETVNNNFSSLFNSVEKKWDNRYKNSYTMDNIQARSRAMFLWGISNEFGKCLPIATSDKSELYMGYATINGDMSGGFAPIADICKTKLFSLAKWMNENREGKNAIPESIILKRPGAELAINPKTGKPLIAEDALMPYEFLDEIIWRIEHKQETFDIMLNSEFLYEKKQKISQEQKCEWIEKFYKRMAAALYKKTIMPPIVIVDSIKADFKQPITSGKINYRIETETEIYNKLHERYKK